MITTADVADRLIKKAQRDKRTLEHRLESFEIRNENSTEDSAEYNADVSETNAKLSAANALIPTLPEGDLKEDQVTVKMEMELKLRKLTKAGNKLGSQGILDREYEMDQLNRQIAGIELFLTEVTARKGELV